MRGGWYSYLHSVFYLTLTAGDKGIKCTYASPKQCKKGPSGTPPLATMAILSAPLATAHRWLHSLLPRALGKAPGEMLVDVLERGYRVVACRGKRLAAAVVLPRPEACRSPGLAGTHGASRQVP